MSDLITRLKRVHLQLNAKMKRSEGAEKASAMLAIRKVEQMVAQVRGVEDVLKEFEAQL